MKKLMKNWLRWQSLTMEVEKLKEFMGENEKKQMKKDLAVQEAVTFLVENAVEK